MYCDFYQMTERPFNVTPDPKCIYLNARYREALASLHYGIGQRKGFITLIGEAGTGKTTLLKRLLDQFDDKTKSVLIFNTHVTFEEILEYLFAEFDLPVHNGKKLYMLQRLNTFLLEELRRGGNVALLIDEAQDLDYAVLEDLRLLSNLETAKEKILQIVLSGQPELGEKLSSPTLRQLRQRVAVSCRLLPLSRDEVTEYIQYRLHAAGCTDLKLFSRDAEDEIYRFSRGIPRLINVVCDNALVIGYALGKRRIGGDIISEASADLMSLQEIAEPEKSEDKALATAVPVMVPAPPRARVGLVAVVLVAIVIGLLSVGRSMLQRSPAAESRSPYPESEPAVAPPMEIIRPGSLLRQPDPAAKAAPAVPVVGGRQDEGAVYPRAARDVAAGRPEQVPPEPAPRAAEIRDQVAAPAEPSEPSRAARRPVPATMEGFDALSANAEVTSDRAIARPPSAAQGDLKDGPDEPDETASLGKRPEIEHLRSVWTEPEEGVEPALDEPRSALPEAPAVRTSTKDMRLAASRFDAVTVRQGDSISRIAYRKYGQATPTILDLLKLANPDMSDVNVISVGQQINLPDLSQSSVISYGGDRYGVLVYSTTHSGRAAAVDSALKERGHRSRVDRARLGANRPIFRVVVDGFSDRSAAVSASKEVQRLFRDDERMAVLVR